MFLLLLFVLKQSHATEDKKTKQWIDMLDLHTLDLRRDPSLLGCFFVACLRLVEFVACLHVVQS